MARLFVRALVVVALVSAGWVAGRAQKAGSWDFEISVNAPAGDTTVTCVRGCSLAWVERSVSGDPTLSGSETFRYGCRSATGRCQSGRVGGWIVKPASAR